MASLPPDEIVRRIKKALARDGVLSWQHMQDLIAVNAVQVFHNEHGAWLTEVLTSPLTKWLNVIVVAGELPHVMDLQPQVIEFAKANGCSHVTATARLGWKHVAKQHGWRNHAMVITHDV